MDILYHYESIVDYTGKKTISNSIDNMKRIIQTSSFKRLSLEGLTDTEMQIAIDELVDKIVVLSETERNEIHLLRTLRYTRFHFQKLQEEYKLNREGEKCVRTTFCH